MIKRLERTKAMLHQESPASIAANAIALWLSCWRAVTAAFRAAAAASGALLLLMVCIRARGAGTHVQKIFPRCM
jgi:hypothetical protein